jgi:hypothetical protein
MNFRQKRKPLPMSYSRHLVPLLLGVCLFFPVNSRAQQPPPKGKPAAKPGTPKPPPHPTEDKKATKALEQAIGQLKKHLSYETALSEHFDIGGLRMELDGTVLSAPGHRLYADLSFHQGPFTGQQKLISDDQTLWQIEQVGSAPPTITRVDLKKVKNALNQPDLPKGVADMFYLRRGFMGPLAVVTTIHDLMMATKLKTGVDLNGHKVNVVTLVWAKPVEQMLLQRRAYWRSLGVAGRMEVYLDESTGWPYRIEWWSSTPPRPLRKTLEIEYRDPNFSATVSPQKFKYDPGSAKVKDGTSDAINQINATAQQLRLKKSHS